MVGFYCRDQPLNVPQHFLDLNISQIGISQCQGQVEHFVSKPNAENIWHQGNPPSWIFLPPCKQPLSLDRRRHAFLWTEKIQWLSNRTLKRFLIILSWVCPLNLLSCLSSCSLGLFWAFQLSFYLLVIGCAEIPCKKPVPCRIARKHRPSLSLSP